MIPVTRPFLPPKEEYDELTQSIWDRNWLTNNGPLVNALEEGLARFLEIPELLFVTNGTIAIQMALKALNITREVITTPFSYVATTSSIVWENCTPVYVDIDPGTLNIDAGKIESAVTENTEAILATHCFGNPCDVEAIQKIADDYGLKVIYDGAHCFGTSYKGKSIYEFGDISTASFHATKVFHTVEGGAVIARDPEVRERLAYLRNFGHDGPGRFNGLGINAKNSEFHAAMGLVNLRYAKQILDSRRQQKEQYDQLLKGLPLKFQIPTDEMGCNYSYYPVIFRSEKEVLHVIDELEKHEIFPRRYFYPSLSELDYVESEPMRNSDEVARRILCLPMYVGLSPEEQSFLCRIIHKTIQS